MLDAVIDEIDGRMIRIGDRGWPTSPRVTTSALTSTARSSTPSRRTSTPGARTPAGRGCWASPVLYEQIEEQLTELLGSEDSLVLPTITHIHTSVIPILAGSGTILLDGRAHKTIYDGCQVARSTVRRSSASAFEDVDHLERLLARGPPIPASSAWTASTA